MKRLPHPDDSSPPSRREQDPVRHATQCLPDLQEHRLLPLDPVRLPQCRETKQIRRGRELADDPSSVRDVFVDPEDFRSECGCLACLMRRTVARHDHDRTGPVRRGIRRQRGRGVPRGGDRRGRRPQGAAHRDRDRHAARFERPRRVESFVLDVQRADLQARDAAPGADALESKERRSSFAARSNLRGLEREERRIPPEIFPRQQVLRSEVLPIVSGEERGTAVARIEQPDRMALRARGAFEEGGAHAAVISAWALTLCPAMALSAMALSAMPRSTDLMETAARAFDLRDAHDRMAAAMGARGRVLVAFSGGVDSGLVARVAHDALGDDALAVLADGESLARWELAEAVSEAREIGIRLETVRVSELANDRYVANPTNRCYFCRQELGAALKPLAAELGFHAIADGVNVSDLGDHRPGIQAMNEAGFWHPLVEFGFTKADVRALARELHLSFFHKPSNACLSSRIAYGEVITMEKLQRVEAAEGAIRALGFRVVRVRAHDGIARIEVPREDLPRMSETTMAERVVEAVRKAGFVYVTVDLRGYRSGSMNEDLR